MKQLLFILILFCSIQGFGQIKGYWRLDGNSNDASGNGNNGTNTAIVYSQANGKLNQGAGFNGSSSKIVISGNSSLRPQNITISYWVYVNAFSATHMIVDCLSSTPWYGYGSYITSSKFCFEYYTSVGGNSSLLSNKNVSVNKWYHVVCTFDSNYCRIYIDGVLDNSVLRSGVLTYTTAVNLTFGARTLASSNYLNGDIDEVIIDNTAWYPARIKNEYIKGTINFAMINVKKHLDTVRIELSPSNYLYQPDFKKLIDLAA